MTSIEIIAHPLDIENLEAIPFFISKETYGVFGYRLYRFESFSPEDILKIRASPFYIEIESALFEKYSEEYFIAMLGLFYSIRIGFTPERQEIIALDTGLKRYYPIFDGNYLYVRERERKILAVNPRSLIGYFPISSNPLIWKVSRIENPVVFEGACVIKEEDLGKPGGKVWRDVNTSLDALNYELAIGRRLDEIKFGTCSKHK